MFAVAVPLVYEGGFLLRMTQDTAEAVCAFRLRNLARRAEESTVSIRRNEMFKAIASGNTPSREELF